jgi:hypothetical protein
MENNSVPERSHLGYFLFLGQCVPCMMSPLYDVSLGRPVPWTMLPLKMYPDPFGQKTDLILERLGRPVEA